MLQGVWIIFGVKQAYDALSVALLHAGSQVHLLCTSEVQAAKVVEDLQRSAAAHGAPREVWLVPGVEEPIAAVLAEPLRRLGVRCLTVTHKAVVGGILAGHIDAVHAEAAPFLRSAAPEGSFPATQQPPAKASAPGRRRTVPWSSAAGEVPKTAVKEEESFPHTQHQQGAPMERPAALCSRQGESAAPPSRSGAPQAPLAAPPTPKEPAAAAQAPPPQARAAKRPAPDPGGGGEAMDPRRRPFAPWGEAARPAIEAGAPLGAVKEQPAHDPDVGASTGRPGSRLASPGRPELENVRMAAPAAQPPSGGVKLEPGLREPKQLEEERLTATAPLTALRPESQPQEELLLGSQAKRERGDPLAEHPSQVKADPEPPRAAKAEEAKREQSEPSGAPHAAAKTEQPVKKHPTGVWLPSLGGSDTGSFVALDGTDVPRAAWSPGAAAVLVPPMPSQPACRQVAHHGPRQAAGCRNFKAFRKAPGQLPPGRAAAVVPVAPWAPAAGPPLAELFCSQPLLDDVAPESLLPQMVL